MKKIFLIAYSLLSANAFSTEYLCPPQMKSVQTATTQTSEWLIWADKLNDVQSLESISVYSGHPDEGASLVPSNVGSTISTWKFSNEKFRIWMACHYGQTYLRSIKELPQNIKKCSILTKKSPHVPSQVLGLKCD